MDAISVGIKLKAMRGSRLQAKVAADLGISKSAIAMYENGERVPKDDIKIAIAKYYGTTVGSLFFDERSGGNREA